MSKIVIGIDPGAAGAIVLLGEECVAAKMPDTMGDIFDYLADIKANHDDTVCYLEDVGQGVPGQSSSATAKFARHNGHLEMALYALGIRTIKVRPQKWMKFYSNTVGTSKDLPKAVWKNKLKACCQQLFPSVKVTLNNADTLLIANYGREQEK